MTEAGILPEQPCLLAEVGEASFLLPLSGNPISYLGVQDCLELEIMHLMEDNYQLNSQCELQAIIKRK